jgi:hypothetical protein
MEPECSLACSQNEPLESTLSQMNQFDTLTLNFMGSVLRPNPQVSQRLLGHIFALRLHNQNFVEISNILNLCYMS